MEYNVNKEYWVAEYSNKQDCYHIGILSDILKKNIDNAINLHGCDYQILFIGKFDECSKFIEEIKKIKNKKMEQ